MCKGQQADQSGHERMNAFSVHTRVQRRASCVSVVISAFFSVCVKVKTEPDYRAFWRAMGSVCAYRGFLLNTGSGGIPGPRRWLLKPNLKEFGKCARGHISGSEQENERWKSDEGRAGKEGKKSVLFVFCGPLEGLVRMATEG